jgi:D-tyrosyl-tRNA(Tyr) deacylase
VKVLIQRSKHASVSVAGKIIGEIDKGLVALVGIEKHDDAASVTKIADRTLAYRVFADEAGKMNRNVIEYGGGVLAISQFTLAADTKKGLRPSFSSAAAPDQAQTLFDTFLERLQSQHDDIACGEFGADMQVSLINDGPVTFMLES